MEQVVKDTLNNLVQIAADSKLSKEFVLEMTIGEHPTNQQRVAKLLVAVFQAQAEKVKTGRFDGRNEATVDFARKIQEAGLFDNAYFPFI